MTTLNRYSARLTQTRAQVGSRAMLFGTGLTEADLDRAQVGIASMWFDGNPCNMHLLGRTRWRRWNGKRFSRATWS